MRRSKCPSGVLCIETCTMIFLLFVAILIAIYLVLDFAALNKISSVLPIPIAITFGMMGNGFFLQEIVRKYNSGHRGIIPKSIFNIFIVYAIFIIYAVISTTLFVAQF